RWGIVTWIVSYPIVVLCALITEIFSLKFFGVKGVEQVAVEQLKSILAVRWLFILLSLTVIFIVPFIEELLFRGFLQTYLRERMGSKYAIIITALLFSSFHFSIKQGIGNIELLVSLF